MKKDDKNNLTQLSIKSCQGLLGALELKAVIISADFDLLWVNPEEIIPNDARDYQKCYAYLFSRQEPCDRCPLKEKEDYHPGSAEINFQGTYLHVRAFPLKGSENFLVIHQDITHISRKKKMMEKIVKKLPLGVVTLDNECTVKYASPAFFHLFPFVKRPIVEKDFRLIISKNIPPFSKTLLDFTFTASKNTDEKPMSLDFEIFSGDPAFFNVICLHIRDNSTRNHDLKNGCLFIFSNQTESILQQARRKQEELQASLESVLHNLYQGLFKKLEKIKSEIDTYGKPGEDPGNKKMEIITNELRALLKELDNLKDYGKVKKKTLMNVNINTLLQNLIKKYNHEISKKKIKIKMDLTRHMKHINASYEKLYKAFELLLLNAMEGVIRKSLTMEENYTPFIEIQTRMHGTLIEITVKDNGIGTGYLLPTLGEDKGLDLSLCQLTIQSLDGSFSLRNVPNVGSKAVVKIPSAPFHFEPDRNNQQIDRKRINKGKRVPLVFRNRNFWIIGAKDYAVEMVQNLLTKNGATYQNIESPGVLGNLFSTQPIPDAFIINVSSERDISGFILPFKRAGFLGKSLFLVPSERLVILKKKLKTYGITHIISKPFPIESLMETLTIFLAKKQ